MLKTRVISLTRKTLLSNIKKKIMGYQPPAKSLLLRAFTLDIFLTLNTENGYL